MIAASRERGEAADRVRVVDAVYLAAPWSGTQSVSTRY